MELSRILNEDADAITYTVTVTNRVELTSGEAMRVKHLSELLSPKLRGMILNSAMIVRIDGDYDVQELVPPKGLVICERPDRSLAVKEAGERYKIDQGFDMLLVSYGTPGWLARRAMTSGRITASLRGLSSQEKQRAAAIGLTMAHKLTGSKTATATMMRVEGDFDLRYSVPLDSVMIYERPDGTKFVKESGEICIVERGIDLLVVGYFFSNLADGR